ncbi:hypothetical protein C5U62_02160 [Pseudomonas protegens]|uniref:Uncharacterized protein n=1 Tax=Pseudomonas protegens TaxID=380021 RepID=A0A2T6GRN8_9PSED|nr:hypothetical protein C5U62_02160 [Pseudomonas protegens]
MPYLEAASRKPQAWSLELGAWSLELGAWSLELGVLVAACSSWRGSLLPLGCAAAPNPDDAVHQDVWGCGPIGSKLPRHRSANRVATRPATESLPAPRSLLG